MDFLELFALQVCTFESHGGTMNSLAGAGFCLGCLLSAVTLPKFELGQVSVVSKEPREENTSIIRCISSINIIANIAAKIYMTSC